MKIKFLFISLLFFGNALAQEYERSGFLIGFGIGSHYTQEFFDSEVTGNRLSGSGLSFNLKIGGSVSPLLAIYYQGNSFLLTSEPSKEEVNDLETFWSDTSELSTMYTSSYLMASFFLEPSYPTFYFNAGGGFVSRFQVLKIFNQNDPPLKTGLSIVTGAGYLIWHGLFIETNLYFHSFIEEKMGSSMSIAAHFGYTFY